MITFMSLFPLSLQTYNTDRQVPDSAGTATAIFSGVKTRIGLLGVDHTVAKNACDAEAMERAKVKSMLHWAVEQGKETGEGYVINRLFFIVHTNTVHVSVVRNSYTCDRVDVFSYVDETSC